VVGLTFAENSRMLLPPPSIARWLLAAGLVMFCWPLPATVAQTERYELGQRLRRFEVAWQTAEPVDRARAVQPLQSAVQSFFSLQLRTAAEKLDDAYLSLLSQQAPPAEQRWIVAHHLVVTPRTAPTDAGPLHIQLERLYPAGTAPADASAQLELQDGQGRTILTCQYALADLLSGVQWDVGDIGSGRFALHAHISSAAPVATQLIPREIERVPDFTARLEQLDQVRKTLPAEMLPTVRATIRNLLTILKPVAAGQQLETDYPAEHLLSFGAALASGGDPGLTVRQYAQRGDLWLALSEGREQTAVRLRAPRDLSSPLPVLFLFHGAGGSENMFFETYGAGRAVELGVERGWLVVAPRQGLLSTVMDAGKMLDELESFFPIDRQRVYFLGHSMGASQVMRQTQRATDLPRAAIAIGGGSRLNDAARVARIPWWIAAGTEDFGRSGASALARSLTAAGATATYREYPDVEHLVIVQAALDDAFAFLEQQSSNR
jgi:predicted esterase